MVNFIENISLTAMQKGDHFDAGPNAMLIQILDPRTNADYLNDNLVPLPEWVPNPKHQFSQRHVFQFLDIEDDNEAADEHGINLSQARTLVNLLQHALDNRMNVVVHCTVGVCRSGAVVEIGEMLGFTPCEKFRIPNTRVMRLMMQILG